MGVVRAGWPLLKTNTSERKVYMSLLTDPTTWYYSAQKVENRVLTTTDPAYKVYDSPDSAFIDMGHHRLQAEERISDPLPAASYYPKIETDGGSGYAVVTECHDCYDPTSEDLAYTKIPTNQAFVDYDQGKVIFGASQEGKDVRATYYKPTSFDYIVHPPEGKKWEIQEASILGSVDIEFTCAVVFDVEFNVGSVESPNWVSYAKVIYGGMWGYLQECTLVQPPIPSGMGGKYMYGQRRRGLQSQALKLRFPNIESQVLSYMQTRLHIYFAEGSGPWGGEHGSATIVCMEN